MTDRKPYATPHPRELSAEELLARQGFARGSRNRYVHASGAVVEDWRAEQIRRPWVGIKASGEPSTGLVSVLDAIEFALELPETAELRDA